MGIFIGTMIYGTVSIGILMAIQEWSDRRNGRK